MTRRVLSVAAVCIFLIALLATVDVLRGVILTAIALIAVILIVALAVRLIGLGINNTNGR